MSFEIGQDARLVEACGKAFGQVVGAIAGIASFFVEGRQVVLAVGVDDVGDQLGALSHEEATPPQQVAGFTLGPRDRRRPCGNMPPRSSPAILPASMRSFLALPPWIAFMYRAWPSTKGMLVVLAQIGEPVPGEHALAADDQALRNGCNGLEEGFGPGRQIAFEDGLALVVEDVGEHALACRSMPQ